MTQQDLKHALVSLLVGVLTIALTQLVTGALHILTVWVAGWAGGSAGTVSYLHLKHLL